LYNFSETTVKHLHHYCIGNTNKTFANLNVYKITFKLYTPVRRYYIKTLHSKLVPKFSHDHLFNVYMVHIFVTQLHILLSGQILLQFLIIRHELCLASTNFKVVKAEPQRDNQVTILPLRRYDLANKWIHVKDQHIQKSGQKSAITLVVLTILLWAKLINKTDK
jgi:hypothetical protein